MSISIGKLERSASELSLALIKNYGFDVSFDTHRSGLGGDCLYGSTSHISLEVAKNDDVQDFTLWANGYGDRPYGQNATWREMKEAILFTLSEEFGIEL